MTWHRGARRAVRDLGVLAVATLTLASCTGGEPRSAPAPSAPTPSAVASDCGAVKIAYDPSNGYEASAFIVGSLASEQLGCDVQYVKTTSRQAWRLVADGRADVYLDAYGSRDLRGRLTGAGKPVTVVGPNGVDGGVDLLAPMFMTEAGLASAQDLEELQRIGWGGTTPAITTVPALAALAKAFINFQGLDDYVVRDYNEIGPTSGLGAAIQQAGEDERNHQPNLYLVAGPRPLLGNSPRSGSVQIPGSAAAPCEPDGQSTLCSLGDFRYDKIVNAHFAESDRPAYSLIFRYALDREDAGTILELVRLSGYNVGAPDVASWLNTHEQTWRRWLR